MALLRAAHLRTLADVLDSLQESHDNNSARVTSERVFLVEFDNEPDLSPNFVCVYDDAEVGYQVEVKS